MKIKNILITAFFIFAIVLNTDISCRAADNSPCLSTDNIRMQKYKTASMNHKQITIKKQRRVSILNAKYSSKNKKIASVNKKGVITAKKSGQTQLKIQINYKIGDKKLNTVLTPTVSVTNHKHNYQPCSALCATCTEPGIIIYQCTDCKVEKKEKLPINKEAHSAIVKKVITGADGKRIEQTICQNCKKVIAEKNLP